MTNASADYRKVLSHFGAIRCRHVTHPIHWACPLLRNTFDPGNLVYAPMWKLALPATRACAWNEETFGYVAEAILAIGLRPRAPPIARKVALWIELASGLLFTVLSFFPQACTVEACRNLGMQAWRVRRNLAIG